MRTLTKKSMAFKAKTKAKHTRELVMALLEWDELAYGNFVMQCAEDYLRVQCGGRDVYGVEMLLSQPLFWAWWCNHWARIDDDFLAKWADCTCLLDLQNEYQFIHSACNLNFRPHRAIMEGSYMQMVQDVINQNRYVKA